MFFFGTKTGEKLSYKKLWGVEMGAQKSGAILGVKIVLSYSQMLVFDKLFVLFAVHCVNFAYICRHMPDGLSNEMRMVKSFFEILHEKNGLSLRIFFQMG